MTNISERPGNSSDRRPIDHQSNPTRSEPIDVLGNRTRLLPLLDTFIKGYGALLSAQKEDERKTPYELSLQRLSAVELLFPNVLSVFKLGTSSVPISEDDGPAYIVSRRETSQTTRLELKGFYITGGSRLLKRTYEPRLNDDILLSTNPIIEGTGSLQDIKSANQISAITQAAEAKIAGDNTSYTQALDIYANELDLSAEQHTQRQLWDWRFATLRQYRTHNKNFRLFTQFEDNEKRNYVDLTMRNFFRSLSQDTYHPTITNTLLFAPTVLDRAVGARVKDSILATCETDPFEHSIDMHLINTYVVDSNGNTHYYKDSHKGIGTKDEDEASLVNWHGFPDFQKAYKLAV